MRAQSSSIPLTLPTSSFHPPSVHHLAEQKVRAATGLQFVKCPAPTASIYIHETITHGEWMDKGAYEQPTTLSFFLSFLLFHYQEKIANSRSSVRKEARAARFPFSRRSLDAQRSMRGRNFDPLSYSYSHSYSFSRRLSIAANAAKTMRETGNESGKPR